ncbi:MAG: MFS transporter [Candidatus Dormibacteria bacterium]
MSRDGWSSRLWPAWLGRNAGVITAARVPMSAGRAIAGVVVPVYLARAGYSALELGLLFTVVAITSGVFSLGIGLASDHLGRKPFLVMVPLLTALAGLALALTLNPVVVFIAASLGSFGRGGGAGGGMVGPYRPAEQALLTQSVAPVRRTSAFARINFASSVGGVVGSLLVVLLVSDHGPRTQLLGAYRPALLAIAGFSLLAGVLAIWLVEVSRPHPEVARAPIPMFPRRSRPLLYRMWVVNGLNGAATGMFGPFMTYWLYRRYGVGAATIGELYAVVNAATLVANLAASPLARWLGIVRATTWFRILQAVLLVPMVLSPTFLIAGAFYLLRMMAQRVALPLRQSYVMGVADSDELARVSAWSSVPSQVTSAAAPALAGDLFEHALLSLPFLLGGALQLASALTFYAFFRHRPPAEEVAAASASEDSG